MNAEPTSAASLHHAGVAAALRGDLARATELLEQAVRADAALVDAWTDLARVHLACKREDEALRCFESAARSGADPAQSESVGHQVLRRGRTTDAAAHFERALALAPGDAPMRCRVARALLDAWESDAAEAVARDAVRIDPHSPTAHLHLGLALLQRNRPEESIEAFRRVLELDPASAVAVGRIGEALARLGRMDEAEAQSRRATEMEPNVARHWAELAKILLWRHRGDEALAAARRAIELDPDDYLAHANAGQALLLMGRLDEGWPEYEHRVRGWLPSRTGRRTWDGSPLDGRAIVLRSEQGFGDTIQFVRYAPLLKQRAGAGRVIVECQPKLRDLLRTADGVDEVIDTGGACAAEAEVWMMSLPARFGTGSGTVPRNVPYVHADPDRAERLRTIVAGAPFKVGVAWAGNARQANDWTRSLPLSALAPLARVQGVKLFSLQDRAVAERDAATMADLGIIDVGGTCHDFADLAAAMSLLDLVVSVCTAPAHLAGALGRPVWTLLSHCSEWRWMLDRADSPWYPTMRLFRQTTPGNWDAVVHAVAEALKIRRSET